MIISKFLKIVDKTYQSLLFWNSENNKENELFQRFFNNGDFERANIMLANNLKVNKASLKLLKDDLMSDIYYLPFFEKFPTRYLKEEFKKKIRDSDIDKEYRDTLKNELLSSFRQKIETMIKHDLLDINFLYETQSLNILVNQSQMKEILKGVIKENTRWPSEEKAQLDKMDDTLRHQLIALKKLTIAMRSESKIGLLMSSISFRYPVNTESIGDSSNIFLALSTYENRIPIKELLNVDFKDRHKKVNVKEYLTGLNHGEINRYLNMGNQEYSNSLFLLTQLTRYLIQRAVEVDGITPESIVNKCFKGASERDPLKGIGCTVVLLYPSTLNRVSSEIGLEILDIFKQRFEEDSSYYNHSEEMKKMFSAHWEKTQKMISGKTVQDENDDILFKKFLEKNKVPNVGIKDDYVSLAKSLSLEDEIVDRLTRTQSVSKELLKQISEDNSEKGLERKKFIQNSGNVLYKIISDYSMVKDLLENKESSSEYLESLEKTISGVQEQIKNIMTEVHQENLETLSSSRVLVKKMIR